jgi:dimethylargininase
VKHPIFTQAIVRKPAGNFAAGISESGLGAPDPERACEQHAAYCRTLEACGLALTVLDADPAFPDSTFVEDTAVVTGRIAVITRPGHEKRRGEEVAIRDVLSRLMPVAAIEHPGTLDGGDVLQAGDHFFIGRSARTNDDGGAQLGAILSRHGYTSETVEVTESLHLKSDVAYIGSNNLVAAGAMAGRGEFERFTTVVVDERERYAANCLFVNGRLLIARGFPMLRDTVRSLGYDTIELEMSEFRKMDGGLSCLSIRF